MSERKPTEVSQPTQAHTPSPWRIDLVEDDYGNVSYSIDMPHRWVPQSEWDANARLIEAAPELLAVCKAAVALYESCGLVAGYQSCEPWINAMRDAIKKAGG